MVLEKTRPKFVRTAEISPTVQSMVESVEIEDLRGRFLKRNILRKRYPPEDFLHVTFLNLGSVNSIVEMLVRYGLPANSHQIAEGYYRLFDRFADLPNERMRLDTENAEVANHSKMVVVRLRKTDQYVDNRRPWVESVMDFVKSLGVTDVMGFMNSHRTMQYIPEENHHPHITLGEVKDNYFGGQRVDVAVELDIPRVSVNACFGSVVWVPGNRHF